MCSISVRHELSRPASRLPSPTPLQLCPLPPHLSRPSGTLPARPLDASPCASCRPGLLCFPGAVLEDEKCLFFVLVFFCVISVKSITNPLQCRALQLMVGWVPGLSSLDLQTSRTYGRALGAELIRMQGTHLQGVGRCR